MRSTMISDDFDDVSFESLGSAFPLRLVIVSMMILGKIYDPLFTQSVIPVWKMVYYDFLIAQFTEVNF